MTGTAEMEYCEEVREGRGETGHQEGRGDAVEVWKKMEVDRHIAVDAGLDDIAELEYFEEEWVRVGGGETGHK